jgi:hypothetical protein
VIDIPSTIADAEQKVLDLMREAILASNGKQQPSCEAFIAAVTREKDPAPLWWLVFQAARSPCIDQLFTKVLRELCAEGAVKPATTAVRLDVPQGSLDICRCRRRHQCCGRGHTRIAARSP